MAFLSSLNLGGWAISSIVSTTKQVSAYVEESMSELGNAFVHMSGDVNVGDVHLQSSLSVGNKCNVGSLNTVNCAYSTAIGQGNIIGVKGYAVQSVVSVDVETNDVEVLFALASGESLDEQIVAGLKVSSTGFLRSTVLFGHVKSVDYETGIAVINIPDVLVRNALAGKTLYFTDANGQLVNVGNVTTSGTWSVAEGYDNVTVGSCSHVEGYLTQGIGTYAHCEGKGNTAGWGAHAEGCNNRAFGNASHALNRSNKVNLGASYSTVEGTGTVVDENKKCCHVAGYMARAKDEGAFVWNGSTVSCANLDPTKALSREPNSSSGWKVPGTTLTEDDYKVQEFIDHPAALSTMYASHGIGTFNINPEGGPNGFYIGEDSLNAIISRAINPIALIIDDLWTGNIYIAGNPEEKQYIKRTDLPLGDSFSYRDPSLALSDLLDDTNLKEVIVLADRYSAILSNGFAKCKLLRKMSATAILSVGNYAFSSDSSLLDVYMPNTEFIGILAFAKCDIVSLHMPHLKKIALQGLWSNTLLLSIDFPELMAVGGSAFANLVSLSSANLPALLSTSGTSFVLCTKLSSLCLPSIKSFGAKTFLQCTSLLCIDMRDLPDGQIPTTPADIMYNVPNIVSCYIPEGQAENWRATSNWATLEQAGSIMLIDS